VTRGKNHNLPAQLPGLSQEASRLRVPASLRLRTRYIIYSRAKNKKMPEHTLENLNAFFTPVKYHTVELNFKPALGQQREVRGRK
jgi:hypothetical protein